MGAERPENNSRTSCVILNYNDSGTTVEQVRRICGYSSLDDIVVVDNASGEDSWEELKTSVEHMENVHLIRAERNGGYGAGNNIGVRYSLEKLGARYVLIANPDTVFSDVCVKNQKTLLENHREAAAVAPVMIDPVFGRQRNGWKLTGFWGSLIKTGPVCRRTLCRILAGKLDYPEAYFKNRKAVWVDAVHGSLLMVDAGKMLECGGYDEHVFLYNEEEILARRLMAGGWKTALLLSQTYRHEHSASISKSVKSALDRQRLRHESAMYYYKEYLQINRFEEWAARCFFAVILGEIWFCRSILKMEW